MLSMHFAYIVYDSCTTRVLQKKRTMFAAMVLLYFRFQALELRCRQHEENILKQRVDDDEVINALQAKMTDLETDLVTQRRLADMAMYVFDLSL